MTTMSADESVESDLFAEVDVETDPQERVTWSPPLRDEDLWFARPSRATTTRPPPSRATRAPSTPPIGDAFADQWFR